MASTTKPIVLDETGVRIAEALEDIAENTVTMTITATATDGVSCAGQTIKVMDVATGIKFTEFVYSGQPQSVVIPKGMSYRVIPVVTLADHYCDDVASGIAMTNVAVSLSYKSVASITTFPALKAAMNAGLGPHIPIGKEVSFTWAPSDQASQVLTWSVMNYNDADDFVDLMMKVTLNQSKYVDAPEALYKATSQLAAGNYSFIHSGATYYFTLTSAIPAGGQLRATTTQFFTYNDAYTDEALETGSVSTTAIAGATSLGTTGAGVLNHMDRVTGGSNCYGESAIDQWIKGTGTNWWNPATMFDRVPNYSTQEGFLSGVPQEVLDAVDDVDVKCFNTSTYTAPDSAYAKNTRYTVNRKFYLASQMEHYGSADFDDGSRQFDAYIGTGDSAKIIQSRFRWLRSPHSSASGVRFVSSYGYSNYYYACDTGVYVVLACRISKSEIE